MFSFIDLLFSLFGNVLASILSLDFAIDSTGYKLDMSVLVLFFFLLAIVPIIVKKVIFKWSHSSDKG